MRKPYVLFVLMTCLFLNSCSIKEERKEVSNSYDEVVVSLSNDDIVKTEYTVYMEFERENQSKIEPMNSAYFGIDLSNNYYKNDYANFYKDVDKKHCLEVYEVSLDNTKNIESIILQCLVNNTVPYFVLKYEEHIGFELNKLIDLSKHLSLIDYPVFVEVMPIKEYHNISSDKYKVFFKNAYTILKSYAKNSQVVFPIDVKNGGFALEYYDERYCDYVSIYKNINNKEIEFTMADVDYYIEETKLKPTILNVSVSYYSSDEGYDINLFENNLNLVYNSYVKENGNIKAIIYKDFDLQYSKENMYNLEGNIEAFNIYKDMILESDFDDFYLANLTYNENGNVIAKTPYYAVSQGDKMYVDTVFLDDDLSYQIDDYIYHFDRKFIEINELRKKMNYTIVVNTEENRIILK
ncbi:MAG: hypothetical protein ACK5LV_07030 [Lachnospirales bacterium]